MQELSSAKYFQEPEANGEEFAIDIKDADWTKGLTIMCFICLVLGLWGLGTAAHGVNKIMEDPAKRRLKYANISRDQWQLLYAAEKVEKDYFPLRIAFYGAKFCLSVALLAGAGILLMKLPIARPTMLGICSAGIAFHVAGAALGCAMFVGISGQIEESSRMTMYRYASGMQNVDGIVNQYMNGVAFNTLLGTFIGLLIKGGIYVRMMLFLNTPFVRAIFGDDPYPEYDEMLDGT